MPAPNPAIPKTHSVAVDLNQIFINLERATTLVFGPGKIPRRRPESVPPPEKDGCHIDTMGKLQAFLQPALGTPLVQHFTRLFGNQRIHILGYGNEHIIVTPTTIMDTLSNEQCSIDQGLAYYLGVGLSITPPSSAQNATDAAMVGFLRCFGAGFTDCPRIQDYSPPLASPPPAAVAAARVPIAVPPAAVATPPREEPGSKPPDVVNLLKYRKLGRHPTIIAKVRARFLGKAAQCALDLARDVHRNIWQDASSAKTMADLIAQYKQRFIPNADRPDSEEAPRIDRELQQFLSALFQSPTWHAQYKRFRNDFLRLGCTESTASATGVRRVDCPAYGVQFTINQTPNRDRASNTVTK